MASKELPQPLRQEQSPGGVLFYRKGVLKNFAKFTGKHLCQSLWFLVGFIKRESPTKVLSCEFYEISKNIFSYRTPPVAASV